MNYIFLAASIVSGFVAGLVVWYISKRLAKKRSDNLRAVYITGKYCPVIYSLVTAVMFSAISYIFNASISFAVECMVTLSICIVISMVDLATRKIPNVTLLALLAVKLIFACINNSYAQLASGLMCAVIALFVFSVPAYMGMMIGAGDIKLAMVAGFYLGLVGFLQMMFIMAVCILILYIILKITRKGNLKTSAPMGPYLSLGFITTLVFPFVMNLI